ncbi:MAG: peroxiredoxin family protein [Steroidobacteraceae bacterium]
MKRVRVRLQFQTMRGVGLTLCLLGLINAARAAAPDPGFIGQRAPDFALPAATGPNVRLSEYRGQPVVLSFWSSQCSLCAGQLAALNRYYGTYRSSGLIVLAVSVDDDPQRAQDYARAHATAFPLLLDHVKAVSRAYGIERLPTTVLIDRSGVVRYLHGDYRAGDESYVAQIRSLLDDQFATP